jgi:ketol-acid reductoisomerase
VTTIYYESDADPAAIAGASVAVVGYGNQGRSWGLNLRDSGLDVSICVRADETRERAEADGFATRDVASASDADVICVLVPDDVIPGLGLAPRRDALLTVASGYTLAFDRINPDCDVAMVAPRMLGPEVRRCYEEGVGFISLVSVHRDVSGNAKARALAVDRAIGGVRQGAIEVTPMQEALVDMASEQILAPALGRVYRSFVQALLERGVPLEVVMAEMLLSGEMERSMRLVRLEGNAVQLDHHSPTSQYGQLSRADRFEAYDPTETMREILDHIESGAFADEWDAERDAGYPTLQSLKAGAAGPDMKEFEADLRSRLGELVPRETATR